MSPCPVHPTQNITKEVCVHVGVVAGSYVAKVEKGEGTKWRLGKGREQGGQNGLQGQGGKGSSSVCLKSQVSWWCESTRRCVYRGW